MKKSRGIPENYLRSLLDVCNEPTIILFNGASVAALSGLNRCSGRDIGSSRSAEDGGTSEAAGALTQVNYSTLPLEINPSRPVKNYRRHPEYKPVRPGDLPPSRTNPCKASALCPNEPPKPVCRRGAVGHPRGHKPRQAEDTGLADCVPLAPLGGELKRGADMPDRNRR